MKRLNYLILKSYIGPLIMTFFIALFILLMQFLWKYVDDLVGKGLEWYVIVELMFYASATFVPLALPLAILLSSLMTFGNLGENYELVAMKAAGISLRSVMKPIMILSLLISIAAFGFSNYVLPVANLKMGSLLYDVREQKPGLNIKEGIFYNGIDGYVIRVGKKEADNKTIHDVLIYDHSSHMGNTSVTVAEHGKMEVTSDKRYLIFTLYNGYSYDEDINRNNIYTRRPLIRMKFNEAYRRFDLSSFTLTRTNEEFFRGHQLMLNIHQLKEAEDSLRADLKKVEADFASSLMNSFYFYINMDTSKLLVDTIKTSPAILESFIKDDQKRIVDNTLQVTRRAKDNIDFYKDDFDSRELRIVKHEIEWQRKFTLSFACFILFFIGAPLGAIIRRGGFGFPVVLSVLFFMLYHIVSITGEKFAKEFVITPVEGMWLSSLILLPMGVILTFKAVTDSPILDSDAWVRFFKKVFMFNKK